MNDALTAVVVAGTALGLAIVLYATYTGLGNVVIAAGGVVVLASVGVMTVAIARYEDEAPPESSDHTG